MELSKGVGGYMEISATRITKALNEAGFVKKSFKGGDFLVRNSGMGLFVVTLYGTELVARVVDVIKNVYPEVEVTSADNIVYVEVAGNKCGISRIPDQSGSMEYYSLRCK